LNESQSQKVWVQSHFTEKVREPYQERQALHLALIGELIDKEKPYTMCRTKEKRQQNYSQTDRKADRTRSDAVCGYV
jgi:hypothetical protein